jgi:DNA-binding transcriptional LysR family regulator
MTLSSSTVLARLTRKARMWHWHVLVKLAELGSLSRAAQAVGLSQPAVTQLLSDLEDMVGLPLFLRHAKGVTPTALAADLLPLARQMLARLEEGAQAVSSHMHQEEGLVRVAATVAGVDGVLAQVLPRFSQAHPQIQVVVSDADRAELAVTVQREAVDMVVCRQPAVVPAQWRFRVCLADRFVVVCGMRHPLARRVDVPLEALRDACWLPNSPGSAARAVFEQLCEQQGWTPHICPVVARMPLLTWAMLDAQELLTLVPLSVVQPWVERGLLQVLPVALDLPFEPLGMLLPQRGGSPAAEKLVRFVAGCLGGQVGEENC